MADAAAPLDLVQRFINTVELDEDADEVATPAALRAWLAENVLDPGDLDGEAHARALRLREAMRGLAAANNNLDAGAGDLETVDAAAARAGLRPRFAPEGVRLEPAAEGVDRALGAVLAALYAAIADGSFARLKACARDDCRWVFHDESRNRSRTWCSMRSCGNRAKAERFRRRRARRD